MNNITILGSNSAIPSINKFSSAQFLNINGTGCLIDCCEGCQMRMQMNDIKTSAVDHIFISHLHGDHFFGLIGLISTMNMQNRSQPLNVYGPMELKEIVDIQLKASLTELNFECNFIVTNPDEFEQIAKFKNFEVFSIPLTHSVKTTGFLFKSTMRNKPFSYAYISDTIYKPEIVSYIENVDVLYHEATYMEDSKDNAVSKFHATCREAGEIARLANAKKLLIGHFSKKYHNYSLMLAEAKTEFENTEVVHDNMVIGLVPLPTA